MDAKNLADLYDLPLIDWTALTARLEEGVRRYTSHGGGPADGALNSAVRATPESSTSAGHPSARQRAAMSATASGSSTRCASPSTTTS